MHLNLRDLLWRMLVFLLSVSTTSSPATLFSSPSPSNVSSEKDSLGSVGVSGGEQLALSQKRKEEFRFGLKGVIFIWYGTETFSNLFSLVLCPK